MYFDIMEEFENVMNNVSYDGSVPFSDEEPSPEEIYEMIWEKRNKEEQLKMDNSSKIEEAFANNNPHYFT